jgi:hypothetical protein
MHESRPRPWAELLAHENLDNAITRRHRARFARVAVKRRGVTRSSTVTVQPDSAANKRKDHRTNSD